MTNRTNARANVEPTLETAVPTEAVFAGIKPAALILANDLNKEHELS